MNCPHLWAVDSSWIELGDGGISTVPLLFPLYFPVAQKMQQGEDKDHRPLTDVYFTRGLWTDSKIKGLSLSSSTLTTQRGLHSFFSLSLSTSDMFWPQMYHVRWQPRGVCCYLKHVFHGNWIASLLLSFSLPAFVATPQSISSSISSSSSIESKQTFWNWSFHFKLIKMEHLLPHAGKNWLLMYKWFHIIDIQWLYDIPYVVMYAWKWFYQFMCALFSYVCVLPACLSVVPPSLPPYSAPFLSSSWSFLAFPFMSWFWVAKNEGKTRCKVRLCM